MKCPYCAEAINDEATVCRYCGRDLSYYKLNKPILERLTSLEDKVSNIVGSENIPPSVGSTAQPVSDNRSTSTASTSTAIKQAIGHVIDRATTTNVEWKQILLAIVLSSSVQVLSNQIWNFTQLITDPQNAFLSGIIDAALFIIITTLRLGSVFAPLVFGFWASLGWPGKHAPSYVLLGLLAGLLTMNGQLGLNLLGGFIGLPSDTQPGMAGPTWISGIDRIDWLVSFVWLLVGPASLFLAGALLGDLAKWERFPQRELERGFTYKVLHYFSGPGKALRRSAVISTQISQAIVSVIVPYLLSSFLGIPSPGPA